MRACLVSALALAVAGCSGQSPDSRAPSEEAFSDSGGSPASELAPSPQMDRTAANAGPDIGITAAPGVAFNYRYAFRLPSERISAVQEAHAAACEELGITRCRITGMRYRVINETDIEAMLAFGLDPSIARAFGRDAGVAVTEAEGMLVNAEITGTDVGASIDAGQREARRITEDIAALEQRLRTPGLSAEERAQIARELETLRQSVRGIDDRRDEDEASLATTPMVIDYGSGDVVPGFDGRTPIRNALSDAGSNLMGGIAFLIVLAASLLPFLLLGLIAWAVWRAIRRQRGPQADSAAAEDVANGV